jgi:hypothetical protein
MREPDQQHETASDFPGDSVSRSHFAAGDALQQYAQRLLHRHGFGEIARLIDVVSTLHRDVVREQL